MSATWRSTPVEERPRYLLESWSVIELPSGARHFIGYCIQNEMPHVSAPIATFDPLTRCGMTRTGHVYQLFGRARDELDTQREWNSWVVVNDVAAWHDVSAEVRCQFIEEVLPDEPVGDMYP